MTEQKISIEGSGLAEFALKMYQKYKKNAPEKSANIVHCLGNILYTYAEQLIPDIVREADLEGMHFSVSAKDKQLLENAFAKASDKIPVFRMEAEDETYEYNLFISSEYDTPHPQSTTDFQYPSAANIELIRCEKYKDTAELYSKSNHIWVDITENLKKEIEKKFIETTGADICSFAEKGKKLYHNDQIAYQMADILYSFGKKNIPELAMEAYILLPFYLQNRSLISEQIKNEDGYFKEVTVTAENEEWTYVMSIFSDNNYTLENFYSKLSRISKDDNRVWQFVPENSVWEIVENSTKEKEKKK